MAFRSPRKPGPPKLGLEPSEADHEYVRTLSRTRIPVRAMCKLLGERFELGKPMSRLTLYHHFREDMERRPTRSKPMKVQDVGVRDLLNQLRSRRNTQPAKGKP